MSQFPVFASNISTLDVPTIENRSTLSVGGAATMKRPVNVTTQRTVSGGLNRLSANRLLASAADMNSMDVMIGGGLVRSQYDGGVEERNARTSSVDTAGCPEASDSPGRLGLIAVMPGG